ncbi:hypothetical protein AYI70_g1702 [Smittium culicis]|uniref:Zn(2)-C6 fungal-type domain-containing protein n=1 Tax=Smittium culicis TaxID=133412 RepID=A0A1R1YBG1_9FUNG|nr:hypothetical protein AYI70_g1702 [Smittium culicis]
MCPFPAAFQNEYFRVMKLGNVFYSCAICRDKKNRCDGVRPACGTCKNSNKFCNYEENFSKNDQIRDFDNICNKLARIGKVFDKVNGFRNIKTKRASNSLYPLEMAKRRKLLGDFNISNLEIDSLVPKNIDLYALTRSIVEKVGLDTEFTDSEDTLLANIINALSRKSLYSFIFSSSHILLRIRNRSLPTYMKYSILSFGVKFLKNYKIFENHVYIRGSTYAQKALNEITSGNTEINADIVFSLLLLSNHYSGINKTYLSSSLLCTAFTLDYIELTRLELKNVLVIAGSLITGNPRGIEFKDVTTNTPSCDILYNNGSHLSENDHAKLHEQDFSFERPTNNQEFRLQYCLLCCKRSRLYTSQRFKTKGPP